MRSKIRLILAVTVLFAARAIHAQSDDLNPAPGTALQQSGVTPREEGQKDRILRLLEVTRALARWTPSEASFLTVLDSVQVRVVGAKESELHRWVSSCPIFPSSRRHSLGWKRA